MADESGIDSISYRDANGVTWKIIRPPGGRMFATVAQDSPLQYDPEVEDVGPVSRLRVVGENEAEERQVLERDIEDAVKGHPVALRVTASPGGGVPWWVWVVGAVVLLKKRR